MDEAFIGSIVMFAGNFAPRNWALCDGSLIAISQNTALFSILGTTYGGDGRTTFGLPDLRGRSPVSAGQAQGGEFFTLGQIGGTEQVTLTASQMPAHTHVVNVPTTDGGGTSDDPNGNILALQNANVYASAGAAGGSYGGVTAGIAGGNAPVKVMSPYLAINYIICLYGIYPSRN